jgi:hypothetical protein
MIDQFDSENSQRNSNLWIALLACNSAFLLSLLLISSNYGLNLTDEGFALLAIKYPGSYSYLFTQFGNIVNPLYQLVGNNIVYLRWLNIFLTTLIASLLFCLVLAPPVVSDSSKKSLFNFGFLPRLGLSFGFSSIAFMGLWPFLTPSYPSVCFLALMVFSVPIIVGGFDSRERYIPLLFSLLVGFSVCLILTSKIT